MARSPGGLAHRTRGAELFHDRIFQRGDPFGVFLGTGSALFSGVFFPTQLISQYAGAGVASISRALPPTYGLDGIRRVLIEGQSLTEVQQPLITLLIFLMVLLPF